MITSVHILDCVMASIVFAQVEYAVTHPQYDVDTVDNDVALLRLPARWPTEPPGVACLPRPRQPLPSRRLCTILGWGKRRSSDMFGTDVLQEAQVFFTNLTAHVWGF